jgi:hypothetical protein
MVLAWLESLATPAYGKEAIEQARPWGAASHGMCTRLPLHPSCYVRCLLWAVRKLCAVPSLLAGAPNVWGCPAQVAVVCRVRCVHGSIPKHSLIEYPVILTAGVLLRTCSELSSAIAPQSCVYILEMDKSIAQMPARGQEGSPQAP